MSEQPYQNIGEIAICDAPRRPWLMGVHIEAKRAVAFQPRCKSWSCPACAEINRRLWGVRAYHGAQELTYYDKAVYFLTLTSHKSLDAEGTIRLWPQQWKSLRQRAVRENGEIFSYLMVPERHKNGRMHVHMLETASMGERWWKDNAPACGLGYMVDQQTAGSAGQAAFYVTKYIGKGLKDTAWPANFRRVRVSRDWPKLPEMENEPGWHWRVIDPKLSLADEIKRIEESGFTIHVLDHQSAWAYAGAVNAGGEIAIPD